MDTAFYLSLFSIFVTLLLGIGVWLNARRTNKTADKKLSIEEDDIIAERRRVELERLYVRVDAFEAIVEELTERLETYETQTVEMLHHVVRLEQMVPNPPGPPTRPVWRFPFLATGRKPSTT